MSPSKIRFIGYPIPTTPANAIAVGNPSGASAIAGSYLANPDTKTDIQNRVAILKNAVDTAKAKLPPNEKDVVNVFVGPEFYFHGAEGPYIYTKETDDPIVIMQELLSETFNAKDYPNWTLICGTAITSLTRNIEEVYKSSDVQARNEVVKTYAKNLSSTYGPIQGQIDTMLAQFIQYCHAYPNVVVRDRAVIVSNIPINPPGEESTTNVMTTEKYYASNEDLLLYEVNGKNVVTEQMVAYPALDLSAGDAKETPFDPYAIFTQGCKNYGVEICLDHADTRLRRNIDNEPASVKGIQIQLIPSCGMQINLQDVAAEANGWVFNCDGEYKLNDTPTGQATHAVVSGVDCIYTNYIDSQNPIYAGHTQLARVKTAATGGDPSAHGSTNASFQTLDTSKVQSLKVKALEKLDQHYAGGAAEVHIYGPYDL